MYIHIYIYTHQFWSITCIYIYIYISILINFSLHGCVYVYVYDWICICQCWYLKGGVRIRVCVSVRIYKCMYLHVSLNISVSLSSYLCGRQRLYLFLPLPPSLYDCVCLSLCVSLLHTWRLALNASTNVYIICVTRSLLPIQTKLTQTTQETYLRYTQRSLTTTKQTNICDKRDLVTLHTAKQTKIIGLFCRISSVL